METIKRNQLVDEMYQLIKERRNEDKILYYSGRNLVSTSLDEFTRQGVDGMLYDLNRLDEVLIATAKDSDLLTLRLPNDLAMVTLIKYLVNKCKVL